MHPKEIRDILEQAKKMFFKALLAGYVGDEKGKITKEKTPDGYTTITFREKDFVVVDRYCTTPYSLWSAGTTTIYFKGSPIWWMSYGGYYEEQAIPFLKKVLRETYIHGNFVGGRGPGFFTDDGAFLYENKGVCLTEFNQFHGREEIHILSGSGEIIKTLGFHEYMGMSLLPR